MVHFSISPYKFYSQRLNKDEGIRLHKTAMPAFLYVALYERQAQLQVILTIDIY